MLLAPFGSGLGKCQFFGHIEPDLAFDDLAERYVSRPRIPDVCD